MADNKTNKSESTAMPVESMLQGFNKSLNTELATMGMPDGIVDRIPTDIFDFDLATGGGVPQGKVSVFIGLEDSFKTTTALLALKNYQKMYPDKKCVYIDLEHHGDKKWLQKLGIDVDNLAYIMPDIAENVIDITESLCSAPNIGLILIDSLAALMTNQEYQKSATGELMGKGGIMINKFYRKLSMAMAQSSVKGIYPTIIAINQIRYKVGVMFGSPETTPGGPSFNFISSLTVRFAKAGDIIDKSFDKELPWAKTVRCIIRKNKVKIFKKNFEYDLCVLDNPNQSLKTGESGSWNTSSSALKHYGLLSKEGKAKEWSLVDPITGEIVNYPTLKPIKEKYLNDFKWRTELHKIIFKNIQQDKYGD